MAKANLHPVFKNAGDQKNKRNNTVSRQKKYRSDSGKVISYGAQESYEVLNPRDYKKNPPKGAELQNIKSFAQASRMTTQLINAGKLTDEELLALPEEEREQAMNLRHQLEAFKARFKAQFRVPDPQAPILLKTDVQFNPNSAKIQRRRYRTLNTFIRAMLQITLKS